MSLNIRKALNLLKPYIPGKSIWQLEKELGRADILRLSFNETPLGPSPLAQQAIQDFLPQIHLYPDASYQDLKEKLAALWNRQPDNFIIGSGTDEIITLLAQVYIEPDDEVILAQPTFGAYRLGVIIQGGKIREVPLRSFQYELDDFLTAITPKTKIVYLCNPNNPTGTYIDKNKLTAFLSRLPQHVLLVLDEAYADYAESADFPLGNDYLDKYNIIVLRTFSKMFGLAGLRIGYGLAKKDIIYDLNRVREPFNVNQLAAVAAAAALTDQEYQLRGRQVNHAGKEFYYREIARLGLNCLPTEANFLWLETGVDSKELEKDFLAAGITIRGGYAFAFPEWIRITIGQEKDNLTFIATLQKLLNQKITAGSTR